MNVPRGELLRLLGWRGQETDEALLAKLDEAAARCLSFARPRSAVRRFSLTFLPADGPAAGGGQKYAGVALEGAGVVLHSADLAAHLQGCREAYLLAATIGEEAERELLRLSGTDMNAALLFDAAASCAVESYADDVCADLAEGCGHALTARFSCGYGDFPLQAQRDICALLRTDVRIGLCCDESFLLTPRKSVTAVAGITDKSCAQESGCAHKCAGCAKADCAFRQREEQT